jgi:outer membrane immunogenic protein
MALKEPPPSAPAWNWTGFYLGGDVGGRWDSSRWNTTCIEAGATFAACPNATGLAVDAPRFNVNNPQAFNSASVWGGFHAGYNWQVTNWVVGVEGNFAWGNNSATKTGIPGAESPTVAGAPGLDSSTVKQTWDSSLRLRGGVLVTPETLVYVTGGAAFTRVQFTAACGTAYPVGWCTAPVDIGQTSTISSTRMGWTVGGGIETRIVGNWLARGEYRYADYGSTSGTLFGSPSAVGSGDAILATVRLRSNIGLLGLAYKFWGAAARRAGLDGYFRHPHGAAWYRLAASSAREQQHARSRGVPLNGVARRRGRASCRPCWASAKSAS